MSGTVVVNPARGHHQWRADIRAADTDADPKPGVVLRGADEAPGLPAEATSTSGLVVHLARTRQRTAPPMRAARFAIVASALLFFAVAGAASAAVRPVDIAGFKFEPQSVTITVGDTVTWTNKDTFQHSARVAGVGTTLTLNQGQSGSLQFMTAGTFSYDCGIHGSSMTGTVIARATATAPPTQAPTPVPTARPTVAPTPVPTPVPTVATTVPPAPIPSPSPTASAVATSAASATAAPTVAVAVPTQQAPAPAGESIDLTALALIAVAVILLIPVAAAGLRRLRGR